MKDEKGFSLLELVTVIVIIGILSAIAAPRYIDLKGDAQTTARTAGVGAVQSAFGELIAKKSTTNMGAPYPTLSELQVLVHNGSLASDSSGVCVSSSLVKTYTDTDGTLTTSSSTDTVKAVAADNTVSAVCP